MDRSPVYHRVDATFTFSPMFRVASCKPVVRVFRVWGELCADTSMNKLVKSAKLASVLVSKSSNVFTRESELDML